MGTAVGIDLGTTNTVVAAVKNGVATTLADLEGNKLIPSVVAFHPNGTVQVGWPALERRIIDPENTVYSVKRLIGRSFQSPEVQQQKPRFPFRLVEGPKAATLVETRAESYALPEISAFVLRRARAIAEAALGETVDAAVITVPANFDDPQRASTKMAGKLAGLEVLRILNEPTAAALAYGRSPEATERLCVYDLGGGTFDVTMLDVSSGVFEVLATAGDTALGGDDIDAIIVDRMANMAMRTLNVDPRNNPNAVARMRVAAEALKKELSFKNDASVEVPDIGRGEEGVPLTLKCRMSRDDLERLAQPIVDKTINVTRQAMKHASVEASAFDRIILVGGATRMPMVVRQVQDIFQKKVDQRINPDEVVALGAAIQAYTLGSRKTRGKKPPPKTSGDPRTAHGVGPVVPRYSGQHNLPKELEAAIAKTSTATMHGVPPAPPATSTSVVPPPGATAETKAEAKDAKGDEPTSVHKAPTRPKMRKVGDVREIPAKRYDPRAEPEDDDEPTQQHTVTTKPPPPASTPRALPDLPPTRPNMPAVSAEQAAAAAAAREAADQGPSESRPLTFSRGPTELRWSSGAPGQAPTDDGEELDLPRPPPMPKPARRPETSPPPLPPALPGDRISGTAPKPAAQHPPWRTKSPDLPNDQLGPDESLLIDVTPLSLRVETVGGYSDVLIAANSQVPCDRTRVFSTAADDQTQVFIRVAQGESPMFRGNTFLGELELSGLVPLPRGEAQIAVTFEIDADGILAVSARDGRSGKETHAKMHVFGAQTEEGDLQRMMDRQHQRKVV